MTGSSPSFQRADGFENLVGLIILILWGIGRLAMSRSKSAPSQPPAAPPQVPETPEDELRRLLEELAGGEPAAPPSPPPTVPPRSEITRPPPPPARPPIRSETPPPVARPPVPPSRPPRSPTVPVRPRRVVSQSTAAETLSGETVADVVPASAHGPHAAYPSMPPEASALKVAIFSAAPRAVLPTQSFGGMATLRGVTVHRASPNANRIRRLLSRARSRQDAIILAEVLAPPRALDSH